MSQPGIVFCDGCDYDLRLPKNWIKVSSAENIGVGPAMNLFFAQNLDLPFYGWLADDFIPRSQEWDAILSDVAGRDKVAYGNDLWPRPEKTPDWITSAFAIGGDLVRAVGWFSPPNIRQAGIDSAWNFLGRKFAFLRYTPSVVVEHVHYKNGKRAQDATDNDVEAEQAAWRAFLNGPEFMEARRRVARLFMGAKAA